jgi:hypothetical protein
MLQLQLHLGLRSQLVLLCVVLGAAGGVLQEAP